MKPKCGESLSNVALNCKLRQYSTDDKRGDHDALVLALAVNCQTTKAGVNAAT